MNRKVIGLVILMILMIISPLFAAGGRNQGHGATGATVVTAAPGQFPFQRDTAELTILTQKAPYLSDFNENNVTRWYQDRTNVRVNYISVPQQGAREATNLLIAAGDLPDIIMSAGLNSADEMNYGSQGIFIRLNELIQEHAYWANEAFKRYDELPTALVHPDGNIYGMPNINEAFHTFHTMKAWINQNWLRTLNLQTPTTTAEFQNVLRAFRDRDPNGNGRNDEIPMMGHFQLNTPRVDVWVYLLNSFVYFDPRATGPSGYLELVNHRVGFVPTQNEYREGLRYVASLVSEGLIDRASFTQNAAQFRQLGTNPDAQLIGVFTDFVWWNAVGQARDTADARANNYISLAPLRGPRGVQYTPLTAIPFNIATAFITDRARDPVLAMRWLDGLYNEEVTRVMQFGVKGLLWDDPTPGALGINRQPALHRLLEHSGPDASPFRATNIFIGNRHSDIRLGEQADWSNPMTAFDQEPRLYMETYNNYTPFFPRGRNVPEVLYFTTQENQEYARLREAINTYTRESLVAFLTGNRNLDRDWDSYVAQFRTLQLDRYLQLVQTAYDRQYRR